MATGLTLLLWGLPLLALAEVMGQHELASMDLGRERGNWALASSYTGLVRMAALTAVLSGMACLIARSSSQGWGRRLGWIVLGIGAVCALGNLGYDFQPSSWVSPWTALAGPQGAGWRVDRMIHWGTVGVSAACGWLLLWSLSQAARHAALPRLVMPACWLGIATALTLLGLPVLESIIDDARNDWFAAKGIMPTPPGSGQAPFGPGIPWYVAGESVVIYFWFTPIRAALLMGSWAMIMAVRTSVRHVLLESVPSRDAKP